MTSTPDITRQDLARAIERVARILQARVDRDGYFPDGNGPAHFDRRVCLQVAAGLPSTADFDRDAFVTAWRSAKEIGSLGYRRALYRQLCTVLEDGLMDDRDRWEGPREPALVRRIAARIRSVHTRVCVGGSLGPFDALVDPADRWHGSVSPRFTLDTVRELADEIQRQAEHPEFVDDTVHVIDRGRTDRDGRPMAIVLKVSWRYLSEDGPEACTEIIAPDEEGRYSVGAWQWSWSFATWWCLCTEDHDWHVPECENCGMDREQAQALKEAAPRVGEILQRLAPETTAVLFEADGRPRIVGAVAGSIELSVGDGGPWDTETLGEADAVLYAALGGELTDSGPHWIRFS